MRSTGQEGRSDTDRWLVAESLLEEVETRSIHASDDLREGLGIPVRESGLVVRELYMT